LSTDRRAGSPGRELWFDAPRIVAVRDGAIALPGPGEVRVRALASGISQGTELLLYRGEGPSPFDPTLDPPGAPVYPRRYGYAWVGEVDALGDDVLGLDVGGRVFALAPHGDAHVLAVDRVRPIGAATPAARAVLAASLETAVTCVWDAGASIGDDVVVIGGGVVGLLVAWLARAAGASVLVVEPSARRRALALRLGAVAVAPDDDLPSARADVVVEATGDPASLDRAIAHAGREAVIVVASFYGARAAPVALGDAFHRRRLSLRASQVSTIPPSRAPRWTPSRRFEVVRRLLDDPALDALIDPPVPFERAADAYARLDACPGDAGQVVFAYV